MTRWALLWLAVTAGCPGKQANGPSAGSQSGSAPPPPVVAAAKTCNEVEARVAALYRADAQAREPKRVDEAVADNTAMAMADCQRDPSTFVPCMAAAASVADLERHCLIPLDDEGTEGEALRK